MNIYLTTSLPSYIDNWTQNVILNSKFFKREPVIDSIVELKVYQIIGLFVILIDCY